jgi:hypothetical protein
MPNFNPYNVKREDEKALNAITHEEDGQNVLFLDNHIVFAKNPFCGIDEDNIYTFWNGGDLRMGGQPWLKSQFQPGSEPQDRLDSLLVHDAP